MSRRKRTTNTPQRTVRRLQIEQLDQRVVFDADNHLGDFGDHYLDPPPDAYLDKEVTVDVTRLAWEYDEWKKSERGSEPFLRSEDDRVFIVDGKVRVRFTFADENPNPLIQEIEPLGGEVASFYEPILTAFIPLESLKALNNLSNALVVGIEDTSSITNVPVGASTEGEDSLLERLEIIIPPNLQRLIAASISTEWGAKLDGNLHQIWQLWQDSKVYGPLLSSLSDYDSLYNRQGDRVLLRAVSTVDAEDELAERVNALGGEAWVVDPQRINAWVPIDRLPDFADLDVLVFSTPEGLPINVTGSAESQGDAVMQVDEARVCFPLQEVGLTIAVISDSSDFSGDVSADGNGGDFSRVAVVGEALPTNSSPTDVKRGPVQNV